MKTACPIPDCPAERKLPRPPPPGCMCGKPLWIVIEPGGHIHPCPVHPDYVVYGPNYSLHAISSRADASRWRR